MLVQDEWDKVRGEDGLGRKSKEVRLGSFRSGQFHCV